MHRMEYKVDGERTAKCEKWLISSFDESVSESLAMTSERDASTSEK